MNIAISNIAWNIEENSVVYGLMQKYRILGLEIAPGKMVSDIELYSEYYIEKFKSEIGEYGIIPVAMQGILFNRAELRLFDDRSRPALLQYVKKMIDFGSKLGVRSIVFGAPKNRVIENQSPEEAQEIAKTFFLELGEYAQSRGIYICIEPNPAGYNTNFLNTTEEAVSFVRAVNHSNIKLNIDLGAIQMNKEDMREALKISLPYTEHLHISEPFLQTIVCDREQHMICAEMLVRHGYNGWVSIEMLSVPDSVDIIEPILKFVTEIYG